MRHPLRVWSLPMLKLPPPRLVYPALTTLLSMAGGLIGYQQAVSTDPSGLREYLVAVGAGVALQVPLSAVVAHRRDRMAHGPQQHGVGRVRTAVGIYLAFGLAGLAAAAYGWSKQAALGYLALVLGVVALQYWTYGAASWQQWRDLTGFWRIQLLGAVARALGLLVLVLFLKLAYLGILLANLAAALAVSMAYRDATASVPIRPVRLVRALRRAGDQLLTADGMLRAGKAAFESLAINGCAMLADRWAGLPPSVAQGVLASVGYVNALAVGMRQLGSGWERETGQKPAPGILVVALGLVGVSAIALQAQWGAFDPLLPRLASASKLQIVAACAAYLVAYPISRGFLFADYLSPARLRQVAWQLLLWFPLAVLTALAATIAAGFPAAVLFAAATPFALALAMRGSRA